MAAQRNLSRKRQIASPEQCDAEPCYICGLPAKPGLFRGVMSCDACARFYIRNRANVDRLKCASGRGDCVANVVAMPTPYKLVRRQFCPKCRLEKCFQAGMPRSDSSNQQSAINNYNDELRQLKNDSALVPFVNNHDASSTTLTNKTPFNLECVQSESSFHLLMSAVAELSVFDSIPFTVQQLVFENSKDTWQDAMVNFEYVAYYSQRYIKELEKLVSLPQEDRTALLSRSLVPFNVAQVSLPCHSDFRFFGMTNEARKAYTTFFPCFQTIEPIIDEVAVVMKAWQPNFIEFSILQALIFFQVESLDKLKKPELVLAANRHLFLLLKAFWRQRGENVDKKVHYFQRVYDLIACNFVVNFDAIVHDMAKNWPDLVQISQVFLDTYQLPASVGENANDN